MSTTTVSLPLTETHEPTEVDQVAALIARAFESDVPVYPIGGGTSLGYGLPAKRDGWGLSLGGLTRVVDYPARDMTITVEAGMTMQALSDVLA